MSIRVDSGGTPETLLQVTPSGQIERAEPLRPGRVAADGAKALEFWNRLAFHIYAPALARLRRPGDNASVTERAFGVVLEGTLFFKDYIDLGGRRAARFETIATQRPFPVTVKWDAVTTFTLHKGEVQQEVIADVPTGALLRRRSTHRWDVGQLTQSGDFVSLSSYVMESEEEFELDLVQSVWR
jgi:hypothetical protein